MLNHGWRIKTAALHAMKEDPIHYNDPRLSDLLRGSRVSPSLPPRFQQNVWRRVEATEAPARPASWLDTLAALILRPRFAAAGVAALLLTGVLAGTMAGQQTVRHEAQMNYLTAVAPQFVH